MTQAEIKINNINRTIEADGNRFFLTEENKRNTLSCLKYFKQIENKEQAFIILIEDGKETFYK